MILYKFNTLFINCKRASLIQYVQFNYLALKSSLKLLPTFSCIWKYLTMHRSKHTLSPLFNSPALCSGLTHFLRHDSVIRPYISAIISNSTCCKVVRFCGICTVEAAMILFLLQQRYYNFLELGVYSPMLDSRIRSLAFILSKRLESTYRLDRTNEKRPPDITNDLKIKKNNL